MENNRTPYESPTTNVIVVKMESRLLYVSGEAGDKNIYNDLGEY